MPEKKVKEKVHPWKCPGCGAPNEGHGKGDCKGKGDDYCDGLCCGCMEGISDELATHQHHGQVESNPCYAECYHCGWEGAMPPGAKVDPKQPLVTAIEHAIEIAERRAKVPNYVSNMCALLRRGLREAGVTSSRVELEDRPDD